MARWRFAFGVVALTAFVIALFALAGLALWGSADPTQRALLEDVLAERLALLLLLGLLLAGLLGALLRWAQAAYPAAAARMAEEVALIQRVNPLHRVTPVRSASLRRLGDAINAFADAHG